MKLLRALLAASAALAAAAAVQLAATAPAGAAPDTACANCWSSIER